MAVTLQNLIDAAAADADKVGDGSVTNAQWAIWAGQAIESWYRLITTLDPDQFFSTTDFTLAGGISGAAQSVAGTNFRAIHGLDLYPDTVTRRTVRRSNFNERNRVIGSWIPTTLADDRQYELRGFSLVITPYEMAGGPYRLYWRVGPTLPVNPSDPLDEQAWPWAEYFSVFMARKALTKEESPEVAADLVARFAELKGEVASAYDRHDEQAARIADVEGSYPFALTGR